MCTWSLDPTLSLILTPFLVLVRNSGTVYWNQLLIPTFSISSCSHFNSSVCNLLKSLNQEHLKMNTEIRRVRSNQASLQLWFHEFSNLWFICFQVMVGPKATHSVTATTQTVISQPHRPPSTRRCEFRCRGFVASRSSKASQIDGFVQPSLICT